MALGMSWSSEKSSKSSITSHVWMLLTKSIQKRIHLTKSKCRMTYISDVNTSWQCNMIWNFLTEHLLPNLSLHNCSYWSDRAVNWEVFGGSSMIIWAIEYINKKRYMRDRRTGRWWRVLELKEMEKVRERGKKIADVKGEGKEKKRRQFRPGTVALQEIHKFPCQEVIVCELGKGDHPRTMGWSKISGIGPPCLARGSRGLCCQFVCRFQFVCSPCKAYHFHAKDVQFAHRIWRDTVTYLPS